MLVAVHPHAFVDMPGGEIHLAPSLPRSGYPLPNIHIPVGPHIFAAAILGSISPLTNIDISGRIGNPSMSLISLVIGRVSVWGCHIFWWLVAAATCGMDNIQVIPEPEENNNNININVQRTLCCRIYSSSNILF
jgi:hypothetical protein